MAEDNKDLREVQKMLLKSVGPMVAVGIIAGGCHLMNQKAGLEDDNMIEEVSEFVIEEYLGLPKDSLDFTPNE